MSSKFLWFAFAILCFSQTSMAEKTQAKDGHQSPATPSQRSTKIESSKTTKKPHRTPSSTELDSAQAIVSGLQLCREKAASGEHTFPEYRLCVNRWIHPDLPRQLKGELISWLITSPQLQNFRTCTEDQRVLAYLTREPFEIVLCSVGAPIQFLYLSRYQGNLRLWWIKSM